MTDKKQEWWIDFFDESHALAMLDREYGSETEDTVAFLKDVLDLKDGDRLFDQCCGTGAISVALAKEGIRCTGVDITPSYIASAKANAAAAGVGEQCDFVAEDARIFAPEAGAFDGAINWYTSFGYFTSDDENIKFLQQLNASLKSGRKIVLDITNPYYAVRHQGGTTTRMIPTKKGDIELVREFYFDLMQGIRGSVWHYKYADGQVVTKQGSSRLYYPNEIKALLDAAGFRLLEAYGGLDKSSLGLDSPRAIYLARKYT